MNVIKSAFIGNYSDDHFLVTFKICTVLKCGYIYWNTTWSIKSVVKGCEDVLKMIFAQSFFSQHSAAALWVFLLFLLSFHLMSEPFQLCMEWPHQHPTLSLPHSLSPTRLALRALPPFFIQSHLVFICPKSPCSLVFFALFSFSRYRCGLFIRAKQQEIPWIFWGPELSEKQQKSRKRNKSNQNDLWLNKNVEMKYIFTLFWVCGFFNIEFFFHLFYGPASENGSFGH